MTDQATRVVPAGWYQDPAAPTQVRWWNGLAWTEHTREKPTPSQTVTASGAAAADAAAGVTIRATSGASATSTATGTVTETTEERIAAARELARQFGISTAENEIITSAATLGHAGTTHSQDAAGSRGAAGARSSGRSATGSAWLIALSPLLALLLGVAAAYVYFYVLATPIVFLVAAVVPYLLVVLWALSDSRALTARGFDAPSPAFALLTAVGYLIVRRIRVPGSGPLAMFVVIAVLSYGCLPLAGVMGQLQGVENALNVQKTVSADYISHGQAVSVSCPAFVDATTVGSIYTCDATTAIGTVKQVWVSIDGPHGQFSYALGLN